MPYNVVEANRQAVQSGLALGAQMFNNNLRMQQLKSQQALQQLQERQVAQRLAMELEAHDLAVEERAEMAKAMARVQLESMPTIEPLRPNVDATLAPGQTGPQMSTGVSLRSQSGGAIEPNMGIPNPTHVPVAQSLMKNVLPVIGKYRPQEVDSFMSSVAMMEYRQAQAAAQGDMGVGPEARAVRDPVTGKERSMFRTGPNSWQLATEIASERQQAAFSRAEMGKMVDWVRKERPDLMARLQRDAAGNLQVPTELIGEVAKQAGITTKTRTDLEAAELGAENVFALGRELLPLINSRTTGAKAEAKRFLQRRGITTLFPALDDPEISEAEAVGRTFTQGVVRALRSDSNIGIREQETLARAAETIEWTTERSGKTKLASLIKRAADTSRRAALRKGTPVNPMFLTKEEIAARVGDGEITPQEGAELWSNSAGSFLQQIEASMK